MTSRLDDISVKITDLSDEELHRLINTIRRDRTTKKTSIKAERSVAKESATRTDKARKLLSSLTAEQKKAILHAK